MNKKKNFARSEGRTGGRNRVRGGSKNHDSKSSICNISVNFVDSFSRIDSKLSVKRAIWPAISILTDIVHVDTILIGLSRTPDWLRIGDWFVISGAAKV